MSDDYIKIKNITFDIDFASLEIIEEEENDLRLYIEVNAMEKTVSGISEDGLDSTEETVQPCFFINNGIKIQDKSYNDLVGKKFTYDYQKDSSQGWGLSFFDCEDITKGEIEILSKTGDSFHIKWTGTANINYNDEYGTDVPFECVFHTDNLLD